MTDEGRNETSREARVAHVLRVLARNGATFLTEPPPTPEQWNQWATPIAEDIVSEPRFWRDYAPQVEHSQNVRWPPITHETDCEPQVMTPEQAAAYREYMDRRPDDPDERARLRRIFQGDDADA